VKFFSGGGNDHACGISPGFQKFGHHLRAPHSSGHGQGELIRAIVFFVVIAAFWIRPMVQSSVEELEVSHFNRGVDEPLIVLRFDVAISVKERQDRVVQFLRLNQPVRDEALRAAGQKASLPRYFMVNEIACFWIVHAYFVPLGLKKGISRLGAGKIRLAQRMVQHDVRRFFGPRRLV